MDKNTLKEKIKHIENQIEAMKKDLDIVSKYSKFPLERSIKSLEDELQEIKELELMMSENEEKGIAELSRGFQSYVLRNINKVKDYPLFETLDLSMNGYELDFFLKKLEVDFGVYCTKTIGANHILITISKI